jgi:hypothetical protein
VCVCVCVCKSGGYGDKRSAKIPDGPIQLRVYRNKGVCGSTNEKSHCVFYKLPSCRAWDCCMDNACTKLKKNFFYSIQDKLKTIMELKFIVIVIRWRCDWLKIKYLQFAVTNRRNFHSPSITINVCLNDCVHFVIWLLYRLLIVMRSF